MYVLMGGLRKCVGGDDLADILYVGGSGELELDLSNSGHIDLKLCIKIEYACGLKGEAGDLAVGNGGEVLLLTGNTLNIDGDYSLGGENYAVSYALVCADYTLTVNEEILYHVSEGGGGYFFQSCKKAFAVEIDHCFVSFQGLDFGVNVADGISIAYSGKIVKALRIFWRKMFIY